VHIAALFAAAVLSGWTHVETGPDGGTVWSGRIPNTFVADTRASTIYLPPGYDATQRYPVLYLLHGLEGSPAEYWRSLHLAQRLDGLFASGARPFIVVTPVGGQVVHPNAGEWAGPWEQYVVGDVVPWVDSHLATIAAPRARVLEGLCAGGYGAVDIGLRHPAVFGGLGSWEGYFTPFRDGPLAHATGRQLAAHDPALIVRKEAAVLRRDGTSFYLSAGGNHAQVRGIWTLAFARELTTLRLRHVLWVAPKAARHRFWSATVPSALQFAVSEFE
jgi:enterochelin esterase-like enzyme